MTPLETLASGKPTPVPPIPMVAVDSTAIAAIGYAGHRRILEVKLRNGQRYRYFKVPAKIAHEFRAAASKGHFYNREIKRRYRFELMP